MQEQLPDAAVKPPGMGLRRPAGHRGRPGLAGNE